MSSTPSSEELKHTILDKLRHDPLSITPDDARRLSEQFEVTDERTANIVSAVEALAQANHDLVEPDTPSIVHDARIAQKTLVNDLNAAVDKYPRFVTTELLKSTQAIVSKMQRALGESNPPHPELEAELQAEFAKIEPKIELGTVTKEEADHLHSLEARAHGRTEKGGLTAVAQSVAAKRERAHPELEAELQAEAAKIEPKIERGTVTKEEADHLHSLEDRAHGHTEKGTLTAAAQSVAAKRERALSLSDTTNESNPTRATSTDASTQANVNTKEVTNKNPALSVPGNHQKDHAKGEAVRGHARKGSSSTAVEAH